VFLELLLTGAPKVFYASLFLLLAAVVEELADSPKLAIAEVFTLLVESGPFSIILESGNCFGLGPWVRRCF
jgi:hypothetical protein